MIVDDSSPAVARAVTRAASSKLFPYKNANTKWCPVRRTCKGTNFSRRKRAAACFLTAIGPMITKTADRKTIMNGDISISLAILNSSLNKGFVVVVVYAWSNEKNYHRLS